MIFYLFSPGNMLCHLKQIVSFGDNLHEMSKPTLWENIFENLTAHAKH